VDCQCGIKGRAVSIDTRKLEKNLKSGISADEDRSVMTGHSISRRAALAGAIALGASLWLGQLARAENTGGTVSSPIKEYDIATNGISLHVTEQGDGPVVLSAMGFRIPLIPGADRWKRSRPPAIGQLRLTCVAMAVAPHP